MSTWGLFSGLVFLLGGLGAVGCKPAAEEEWPYGAKPVETGKLVASPTDAGAPLETPALPGEQPDASVPAVAPAPSPVEEAAPEPPEVPPAAGGSDAGAGEGEKKGEGESEPAAPVGLGAFEPFVGRTVTSRGAGGVEVWTFRATGFFDWKRIGGDGNAVERTGTYRLDPERLTLQYKETQTLADPETGARRVTHEMGEASVGWAVGEGGALVLDGQLFVPK